MSDTQHTLGFFVTLRQRMCAALYGHGPEFYPMIGYSECCRCGARLTAPPTRPHYKGGDV